MLRELADKMKKENKRVQSGILANKIKKLESDGLDIMMCRSQGYDNAAVMSGVHGGVQAIVKAKNKKAVFCLIRWQVLIKLSKTSVKKLSSTRWSHYVAVKLLADNFSEVVAAIWELCDQQENVDTTEKRDHILEEAIGLAAKKSEEYDIPIEKRIRRKKRMAGEIVTDAGLTLTAEYQQDILECPE
ncbi:hypothetical protein CBL_21129 [Carabus blaptoides fortunei]